MSDYLAFVYGHISKPGVDALSDGQELANQCLRRLDAIENVESDGNKKRFPPRLLILLASPAYLHQSDAEQLLNGVYGAFTQSQEGSSTEGDEIQLIGSTVAAVFFDGKVHSDGALLVCLASKLIKAQVAFGPNAREDPRGAVHVLLKHLKLDPTGQVDPNPLANRRIMTFMPGCNQAAPNGAFYPAPEIHRSLYQGVQSRIRLVGGISSANDPSRRTDGLQFAQNRVLRDAVVAVSINSDVPIGVSLNDGLAGTKRILQVTRLSEDKRTILEFDSNNAAEELGSFDVMLAKLSAGDERVVDIPLEVEDGAVQLLRQVEGGDYFEVVQSSSPISEILKQGIEQAKHRVYAKRPIAALVFGCKSYARAKDGVSKVEAALSQLEKDLDGPCVGGFFDGELGVDETGRSRLTNGGIGYVVLGDELRERTPLYNGPSALAKYGGELLAGFDVSGSDKSNEEVLEEAIGSALDIVNEAGFPGAMISLTRSNLDRVARKACEVIIAQRAFGQRFSKIVDVTKRPLEGDDILAFVTRDGRARFVADSKLDPTCHQPAIERSSLVSQYVLPLKRLDGTVFGTLQVDLGDLRNYSPDDFLKSEQARMLDCFGVVVGAGIHRIAQTLSKKIIHSLDRALKDSMSAYSINEGLEQFVKKAGAAFGADMAHLRLWEAEAPSGEPMEPCLVLVAGYGASFEAEQENRREIPASSRSPIGYAFDSDEPQLVNDLTDDPAWREMLDRIPPDSSLRRPLSQVKSYAAVSFCSDLNRKIGAISLGSLKPWFFFKFHQRALKVLAERLAFLVEHLKATVQRDSFFQQRDFLFKVSPNLAEQNLRDIGTTLQNVTHSLRKGLRADVASLYLWDRDREQYVLRAQEGWKRSGWVHAASYDTTSGWIGVKAINQEPLYVPDLFAHYKKDGYEHSEGLYARYMFGKSLSENFRVEAIGLPLRIGPKKKDKFGVVTLYRHVNLRRRGGFTTTDPELLLKGTYNAAGLVNAVLMQRDDDWEKRQASQRNEVVRAINSAHEAELFEASVCREVLKSYQAAEVSFYRIDKIDTEIVYSWITGYRYVARSHSAEKMEAPSVDHNHIIQETKRLKKSKPPYGVVLSRRKGKGHSDPRELKIRKLVEKASVPLLADGKYRAVIVICWKLNPSKVFALDVRQDARHLQKLGQVLGEMDLGREMKEQAHRNQLAVQTAGIYVFQHAHKLGNATQSLYRITQEINDARNETERRGKIQDLKTIATDNNRMIDWIIDFGQQVQNPVIKPVVLRDLLEISWQERAAGLRVAGLDAPTIEVEKEITVLADLRLAKEVFVNLINNALKALTCRKNGATDRPRLQVSAIVGEDQGGVSITFYDNGEGMRKADIVAAEKGFVQARPESSYSRHKGVGVLISKYLLQVQKGSLTYDSEWGKWTTATVNLPLFRNGGRRK